MRLGSDLRGPEDPSLDSMVDDDGLCPMTTEDAWHRWDRLQLRSDPAAPLDIED